MVKFLKQFFLDPRFRADVSFFQQVSILDELSARDIARLIGHFQKRHYSQGEVIFQEGDVGKAVYVIHSGKVVLTRGVDKEQRTLRVLGSGDVFGEMALLEESGRTATATVAQDGELYLLYKTALDNVARKEPKIGTIIYRNMAVILSRLLRSANSSLDGKD